MSLFSSIGHLGSSLLKGVGSLFGGGGGGWQTPFNPGAFVNTPATLSNAISSAVASGDWVGDTVSNILGGHNWIAPVDVSPSKVNYNITPTAPPLDLSTAWSDYLGGGWQSPQTPNFTNTGMPDLSGLLNFGGSLLSGGGQPQTVGTIDAQPPPQPVQLINTPASIPPLTQGGGQQQGGGFDVSKLIETLSAAGILGSNLLGKNNDLGPDAAKLRELAGDLGGRQKSIMDTALANQQGMINGEMLNGIERRLRQAQARTRQTYSEMGMSGSTMESQDLGAQEQAAMEQVSQIGQEMAVTGLQTAAQLIGDETGIYQMLMYGQLEKDQELTRALAEFAAASAR